MAGTVTSEKMRLKDTTYIKKLRFSADSLTNRAVIIITGAGISTSCGIPDFRSPNGYYAPASGAMAILANTARSGSSVPALATHPVRQMKSRLTARELFDATTLLDAEKAKQWLQEIAQFRDRIHSREISHSPTHELILALKHANSLRRCYTQNIDNIESRFELTVSHSNPQRVTDGPYDPSGTNPNLDDGSDVVQLHGSIDSVRCTKCYATRQWDDADTTAFAEGHSVPCTQRCAARSHPSQDKVERRNPTRTYTRGVMRPDILLYNDSHDPDADFCAEILHADQRAPIKYILIFGTSLAIPDMRKAVMGFANAVHAPAVGGKVLFINKEAPPLALEESIDYWFPMACDDFVKEAQAQGKLPCQNAIVSATGLPVATNLIRNQHETWDTGDIVDHGRADASAPLTPPYSQWSFSQTDIITLPTLPLFPSFCETSTYSYTDDEDD